MNYARLRTETSARRFRRLDRLDARGIVDLMSGEDAKVARAVATQRRQIARAVEMIVPRLKAGRLWLVGAGTSGRLCVMEAVECVPTFNSRRMRGVIAGGAMTRPSEGAEDRVVKLPFKCGDVVCGVSASGVTRFVLGALKQARRMKLPTILVTCNPARGADVVISVPTGPEVVAGSTRLKAGTATKMVLNMLTTASFVRLGKVRRNLMVDVRPTSRKLRDRKARIAKMLA